MIYLNIAKLTEQQYDHVFIKRAGDEKSITFREKREKFRTKSERDFNKIKPFNKTRFRELFYADEIDIPKTLLLRELFKDYYTTNDNIKHSSKGRYWSSMNIFETFMKDATFYDVTSDYLMKFERWKQSKGNSPATIASNINDLKRILNYYTKVKKVIPRDYEFPFSEIEYQIKNFIPNKPVLGNNEIKSIVEMKEFDSSDQEYARDIWLLFVILQVTNIENPGIKL